MPINYNRGKAVGIEAASVTDEATSFLEIARSRAQEARERYALLAAELYKTPRGLLTDAERSRMTGMIAGLVEEIMTALDRHGGNRHAPESEPILAALRRAEILTDPELIEAAYHRLLEFELQSRARGRAQDQSADPIASLLRNASMPVVHAVTEFKVWRSKRLDAYQNPVLLAVDLPNGLARRLHWAVAAAYRVHEPSAEDTVEDATSRALAELANSAAAPPALAARRLVEARLAGAPLLRPLFEAGEIELFEALLARLSGPSTLLVRRFLFEPGGESLAVCARVLDLGCDALRAILDEVRAVRRDGGDASPALALYDRLSADAAATIVKRWARQSEFQAAVRLLEG